MIAMRGLEVLGASEHFYRHILGYLVKSCFAT